MMTIHKPWGHYDVLAEDASHWYKRILVLPRESLSLQVHENRDEFWIVESGQGCVQIGDTFHPALPGNTFFIPKRVKHRCTNTGSVSFVFTEVAVGKVDENDIVRLEDEYGRT
jgi:mannose-6-phosphate isomerase-like protein (cupin superfamily)